MRFGERREILISSKCSLGSFARPLLRHVELHSSTIELVMHVDFSLG